MSFYSEFKDTIKIDNHIPTKLDSKSNGLNSHGENSEFLTKDFKFSLVSSKYINLHSHSYIQILVNLDSTVAQINIDHHSFSVNQADIFIIGRKTIHQVIKVGNTHILQIDINNKFFIPQNLAQLNIPNYRYTFLMHLLAYYSGRPSWAIFNSKQDSGLFHLLTDFYQNAQSSNEVANAICGKEFLVILLSLLKYPFKFQTFPEIIGKVSVSDMCQYIESNYNHISLSQMSQDFGYHPNYVNQKLKKYTRYSFTQLVAMQRINAACTLIKETQAPLSEISIAVGYSNLESFYKNFRKLTGMNPKIWKSLNM